MSQAVALILTRPFGHYRALIAAQGGSTRFGTLYPGGLMTPVRFLNSANNLDALAGGTSSANDFEIIFTPTLLPQNLFYGVTVQDQTGAYRFYKSADAFFGGGGGNTSWEWGTGSSPVWAAGAVGSTFNIEIL